MQILESLAVPPRMPFSQNNHNLPAPVIANCRVLPCLRDKKALVTGASSGDWQGDRARAGGHAGVGPGAIRRPINMRAWDTPNHYAEPLKRISYGRIGEPEEIGRAAVVAR